ncbi:hypothetical protein lerEdw1_003522 [Lerista edwardsae]|nr:hypothetical protein lerEdw1_003522 [Lerista edwardsae]
MAASTLENQLHSAQKNLLFLQREHANTLKGLHAEIRRLQQHCTGGFALRQPDKVGQGLQHCEVQAVVRWHREGPQQSLVCALSLTKLGQGRPFSAQDLESYLTYELTLKSSELTESGNSRTEELRRKCEELEAQLKTKEAENNELLKELEQKNAVILVLENTMKEREKRYLEELKMKSHKLNMLSSELEQRASTIAYLTSQLHATKKKLMSSSGTSDSSPSGSPVLTGYKPAPPKDKLPDTPRRRMKKSLSTPLNPEFEEAYRLGSESRKLLLREPVDAMPDPTPFLLARETAENHLIRERPLVIPPIPSERPSAEPHSPARGEKSHHKAHVGVAHRIHHVAQAPPEVETLAVDQVNGSKAVRKHSGTDRTV